MTEKGYIDPERHEMDHHWIADEIEERKRCRENRQTILTHVLGWGAVSIITAIGYMVIRGVKSILPMIGSGL